MSIVLLVKHMDDFIHKLYNDHVRFDILFFDEDLSESLIRLYGYKLDDINPTAQKYIIHELTIN